jgi:putative nucleotidyltransferase with HDIG domain
VAVAAIAAVAALVHATAIAHVPFLALQSPDAPGSEDQARNLLLAAELLALSVVAQFFHVSITPRRRINVANAVYFTVLLLFGATLATVLGTASQLLGQGLLTLRRGHRRTARAALFNASQYALALALGGVTYQLLPQPWATLAGTTVFYLANTLLVAGIAGLQLGISPLELWLVGRPRNAFHESGLLLIGWITARTAVHDIWMPMVMAVPAAIVYTSLQRHVQLVEQTVEAVEAMADVVDERDRYTFQHSKRVAEYSEKIARAMRLPRDQVETIRSAARVHDLGKIGVPDDVLRKPGKLTDEEWQLMRQHAEKGYQVLARFPEYTAGREMVHAHHEHWDGSGYPRGLAGDAIPLGAQIIAASDTFDAMTSDRPYRKALPIEVAAAELARGRGRQWSPAVIDAAMRAIIPPHVAANVAAPPPRPAATGAPSVAAASPA